MSLKKGLFIVILSLAAVVLAYAAGMQTTQKKMEKAERAAVGHSSTVGIYMESVQRQINLADLQHRYPGNSAQKIDPEALKADAIVGWYDRGNNFHEQKMQNNLKSLGGIRILPEMLKGTILKGVTEQQVH